MALKCFTTTIASDYQRFLRDNPHIRIINVSNISGSLVVTYLENNRPVAKLATFFGHFDDLAADRFHAAIGELKDYFRNPEIIVVPTGSKAVYKVMGYPIEGSHWETFVRNLGLTQV